MAWCFGDGFDAYNSNPEYFAGYWNSGGSLGGGSVQFGRFGGQGLRLSSSTGNGLSKTSGVNDAVHHIAFAFYSGAAVSSTTLGFFCTLYDGATAQCSVVLRQDGTILLAAGLPNGTVLATWASAFTLQTTWYQFEFEIVINNTTGSFAARRNGNTSNDFSATSLNTRASANNYANGLTLGNQSGPNYHQIDDFLWKSDASSVAWMGDVRCYTRYPATDASTQFARTPATATFNLSAGGNSGGGSANQVQFASFTAPTNMKGPVQAIGSNGFSTTSGLSNMAIYDATGTAGAPGNLIANGTATQLNNAAGGPRVYTFATPPTLTPGGLYYAAFNGASSGNWMGQNPGIGIYHLTFTYSAGAFPSSAAGATPISGQVGGDSVTLYATPVNATATSETLNDALTTYVYDATPGHADFYNLTALGVSPTSVIAVTVRGYMEKADAGPRNGTVQLKSGAATVAAPTLAMSPTWQWAWRTDMVDPNTGAAWTAANVSAAQIGPVVIS